MRAYLRCGHLDNFLCVGLIVETIPKKVTKVSEGPFDTVGDGLLLALQPVNVGQSDSEGHSRMGITRGGGLYLV